MKAIDLLLGRRLANSEEGSRKIGWFSAVAAMGLDGLSSSAYGPEAALTIMAPLGAAGVSWLAPVMAPIILLLAVLFLSYRQTIVAYPSNGGAYTVSRENLGSNASLVAAAALMIDYVLNVAVGISAGIGALTSTLPHLQPYTLPLCLGVLAVVTIANLRGTGEAGLLFAFPTYVFLASFFALIALGLWRVSIGAGHPHDIGNHFPVYASEAVSLWLLMRAFAAGCTAMTGVEAVSNGVGVFKKPVVRQAHTTLTMICVALGLLLVGIAALVNSYGLGAMDQSKVGYQSILSQLASAVVGRGPFYYVAMTSLLVVLCLSANTSYVGFPRICKLVAEDGFLPRTFAMADRRLVFSVGIGFLTACAGALLIVFGGITDRLIPLFAIGAFLTFTMSQVGMVAHWRKQPGANRGRLAINAIGAMTTAAALAVIIVAKFIDGAWIVLLAMPALIVVMMSIRRYRDGVLSDLAVSGPFEPSIGGSPVILVAFEGRNRMTDHAIEFAMTLSPDVIAAHLLRLDGPDFEDHSRELRRRWKLEIEEPITARGLTPPRLMLLPAPFREIHKPLLALVEKLDREAPGRAVAVLIPSLIITRWWQLLLNARRAEHLRAGLLEDSNGVLNVILVPWRRPHPKNATHRPIV